MGLKNVISTLLEKEMVIIGQGAIVVLWHRGVESWAVTVCHSHYKGLAKVAKRADIFRLLP